MQDYIQILKKIPDKGSERDATTGANLETVSNPVLCVSHSIMQFRIDDNKCDGQIIDWLNKLEFKLSDWNEARNLMGLMTNRHSQILAINDVIRNFDFEKLYLMNSGQLKFLPGLNKAFMTLPPLAQGIKLVKEKYQSEKLLSEKLQNNVILSEKLRGKSPKNLKSAESQKATFRDKLAASTANCSTAVVGSGPVKTGTVQKKLRLYLRILKGVDLTKILTMIKSKKTVSSIEIIEIRKTQQYSSSVKAAGRYQ